MWKSGSDDKFKGSGPAHTLISRTTEIIGDLNFNGELIIEGKVRGNIYAEDESNALIRVTENGVVEGDICVPSAIINGLVQGEVRSIDHIELAVKATVVGNVYYNLIEMVMGSEVNGSLMHIGSSKQEAKLLSNDKKELPFKQPSLESS